MHGGIFSPSMCSAKACAATFSLVRIMRLRLGSKTSRPTTKMAADLVLPAPKTPLMGRSVLPSSRANTSEPMVERTCSSGLHSNGYIALIRASSATLLVQQLSHPIANFSNFTAAEKSRVLLLGTSGTCGSVHWRPQPTLSLSIGILMKTSSSLALRLSPMKYIWSTVMIDLGEWAGMQWPSVPYWRLGSNCSAGRQKASAISWGSHAKSVDRGMTCFHNLWVSTPPLPPGTDPDICKIAWKNWPLYWKCNKTVFPFLSPIVTFCRVVITAFAFW